LELNNTGALTNEHITHRTWNVNVGTSLPYGVFDQLELIVKEQHTSRAVVIRRLLLRGIAAFERDGLLDDPEAAEIITHT
jgi:hypothetical protein